MKKLKINVKSSAENDSEQESWRKWVENYEVSTHLSGLVIISLLRSKTMTKPGGEGGGVKWHSRCFSKLNKTSPGGTSGVQVRQEWKISVGLRSVSLWIFPKEGGEEFHPPHLDTGVVWLGITQSNVLVWFQQLQDECWHPKHLHGKSNSHRNHISH